MAIRGKGTKYAKKYVMVDLDVLRHEIIPQAADYCAQQRAIHAWTPEQYRACLREEIRRRIRERSS